MVANRQYLRMGFGRPRVAASLVTRRDRKMPNKIEGEIIIRTPNSCVRMFEALLRAWRSRLNMPTDELGKRNIAR